MNERNLETFQKNEIPFPIEQYKNPHSQEKCDENA